MIAEIIALVLAVLTVILIVLTVVKIIKVERTFKGIIGSSVAWMVNILVVTSVMVIFLMFGGSIPETWKHTLLLMLMLSYALCVYQIASALLSGKKEILER